jgi:N6-L-threonylcarbamoyladenine synthase
MDKRGLPEHEKELILSFVFTSTIKGTRMSKLRDTTTELTLAVETSCDETAAAVVDGDLNVLSNVISSQIDIHARYGGVVPEVASRNHLLAVEHVTAEALQRAGISMGKITRIAATTQPGLIGAVMVGRVFAESVSTASGTPFAAVNHLCGHIASAVLSNRQISPPFLSLVVSGGHTNLYKVESYQSIKLLASTTDDACGEAFDKVAKILDLGYPGGPAVAQAAALFRGQSTIKFLPKANYSGPNFSYSGLKTAVLNFVNKSRMKGEHVDIPAVCEAFQREAVDQLVIKTMSALKRESMTTLCICGGVSANDHLRAEFQKACDTAHTKLYLPALEFCGDNAAMIAAAAILGLNLEENH